jgi:predicted RNA-binding protein with PUA-like domain
VAYQYWLFKSEPDDFSISDLGNQPNQTVRWDGIRNYQARNLLRDQVRRDDAVLFYHSSCKIPAVVGTAIVTKNHYPDPLQFDPNSRYFDPKSTATAPRWLVVDIRLDKVLAQPVPLKQIKADPALRDMVLVKQGRLSIQPVTEPQWRRVLELARSGPG